jgi:hypothetical protein
MKPENYRETLAAAGPWQIRLTCYQLGQVFYCHADNVSPGATIARARGATQAEAEQMALQKARQRLEQTRIHPTE